MENQEAYKIARKRVEARVGFYVHLGIYIAVGILLLTINLKNSPETLWVKWPMMGWGIGVLFHAAGTFIFPTRSEIINNMVEKEMKKNL